MSIVVLKRKTQAQYNNMSVGMPAFSLNGTHRSQGFVGQTSLSRTLVRSLARGSTLRGHGGCCGTYPICNIKRSPDMSTLENNHVVKSSVLDTNGMLMTKHRWIRRPYPYARVKPDATQNTLDQGDYIDSLARSTLACDTDKTTEVIKKCQTCVTAGAKNYQLWSKTASTITKDPVGALSGAEYLRKLNKSCVKYNEKPVNNTKNTSFACGILA